MKVIEYFATSNKELWISKIGKSDWSAGKYLAELLRENKLSEMVGETVLVPMLTDGEELVGFCTLAPRDDIQATELSPWIGFIYTFPKYREHRYAGLLLEYSENIAKSRKKEYIYISTGHEGLYEKYGYEFLELAKDIGGKDSRIYRKALVMDRV